jgi:hypothetical protein
MTASIERVDPDGLDGSAKSATRDGVRDAFTDR